MRDSRARIGVLLLLIPLSAWTSRGETLLLNREDRPYQGRSATRTSVECGGEVRPDRAVIVGGVTAESLRPSQARAQVEKQLAAVQTYVEEQGGRLTLGERVRAVRGASRTSRDPGPDELPFVTLQRLEVDFPIEVDIDEILDRLLQLGLDMFGRKVSIGSRDRTPKVVVRYRFSDLRDALERLHAQCKSRAVEKWCAMSAAVDECESCTSALGKLSRHLVTRSLTLESQPILDARGRFAPIRLSYPWREGQLALVELIGDVGLRLHGTITVVLPGMWSR